jgi:flavodoxin
MKALIVYYSWTGNTKGVAEAVSSVIGGKLRPLMEKHKRRKRSGFLGAAFGALIRARSALESPDYDTMEYDTVFIGTPVWAMHPAPAINSFLRAASLQGKSVYLFTTNASGKPQRAVDSLSKKIRKKGGTLIGSFSIRTDRNLKVDPKKALAFIKEWAKEQKLLKTGR